MISLAISSIAQPTAIGFVKKWNPPTAGYKSVQRITVEVEKMRGGQVRTVVGHLWKVCRGVTLRDVAETAANRRLDHQIDVCVGDQSQLDVGQLQRQLQCHVRKAGEV